MKHPQNSSPSSAAFGHWQISKVFSKLFNAIYCSKKEKRRGSEESETPAPAPPDPGVASPPSPKSQWFEAIQEQRLEDAQLVLASSPIHVDAQDSSGWAAVHISAWNGYTDLMRFLLTRGADINLPGPGGCTPVALASQQGHADLVAMLISANCDVTKTANLSDNFFVTPLHLAAQNGHVGAVRLLIDAGAKVNAGMVCPNVQGVTALHLAVQAEHLEVMDILIGAGGDVDSSTQRNAETSC